MFLQKLVDSNKFLEILYTNNIHYWFEKKLRNIFVFCLAFLKKIFILRAQHLVGYSRGRRGGFAKPVGCRKVPQGFESPTHRQQKITFGV